MEPDRHGHRNVATPGNIQVGQQRPAADLDISMVEEPLVGSKRVFPYSRGSFGSPARYTRRQEYHQR
jgi:hypothetical protein